MSKGDRSSALEYLMFLKKKRDGSIKGRGCADGRSQRSYISKEESSSPTISTEAVMITCAIEAAESRDVATVDIPGAYLSVDMDELVYVRFRGVMAEILQQIDPGKYKKYTVTEKGKPVIYAALNKALYGTLRGSLLFWKKLIGELVGRGYEWNPYDWCVVNRMVDGKQFTIGWHVDDLKLSHIDPEAVSAEIEWLEKRFGTKAPLTVRRGKVHEYLGMTLDYSPKGKVVVSMVDYLQGMLDEAPLEFAGGSAATPAANYLFDADESAPKLDRDRAARYFHHVMQFMWVAKRARPDLLLPVSYLATRVKSPDVNDWKKLGRVFRYAESTKDLVLTLEGDKLNTLKWYVDASFAVHDDMKSHTGAMLSLGKGCVYASSTKHKINANSSTHAELVSVSDMLPQMLWTKNFIEAQGYDMGPALIYQDNQSAIKLEINGRASSGKKTRHIEIRYFFVADVVSQGNAKVVYCPTEDMLADFFTKPLQGSKFLRFRDTVLNIQGSPHNMN